MKSGPDVSFYAAFRMTHPDLIRKYPKVYTGEVLSLLREDVPTLEEATYIEEGNNRHEGE